MDREALRVLLGQGDSVERIAARFRRHPSTVAYWIAKHGLEANGHEKHAAKGGLDREVLETLVTQGCTIREIAAAVNRSAGTVRHWLGRYGLKTQNKRGPRPGVGVEQARESGLLTVIRQCDAHGTTPFVLDVGGRYRCRRCRSEAVTRRRRRVKRILVAEAGGRCHLCGYDRYPGALAFHHLDPSAKRITVSASGFGLGIETLRAEAGKCMLLCANCHAEVEGGAGEVSLDSAVGEG